VSLRVYNVAGQLVKTLVDEEKTPGEHQVIWDGKNQQGDDVASGVYFYRLSISDFSDSRRMVLLK
jgi:flagellar hook assembly protein FlgD